MIEREEIYQRVWGYAMAHGDRSVDVFVRKLRSKLQRHSPGWDYIHTHFGIGYRFDPKSEEAAAAGPRARRAVGGYEPSAADFDVDAAVGVAPQRAADPAASHSSHLFHTRLPAA